MNLNDLNILTALTVSAPAANTATATSAAVDLQPFEGVVKITQTVGVVSGTAPTWDFKIQDCDTSGGSYADVAGLTLTQVTASTSTQSLAVDTRLCRRYIKVVQTLGGSSTPTVNSAVVLVGMHKRLGSL